MRPSLVRGSSTFTFLLLFALLTPPIWAYEGSSFNAVKQIVFQNPYDVLPQYRVSKKQFGKKGVTPENYVLKAAKRTLTRQEDLWDFPNGQKLFQANGICFSGEWIIDKESLYTGQFQYLTRSRVIARASVALSGTKQSDKRAFGFALKLFPSSDPNTVAPTLNAFVMHSLGGTYTQHVLDLVMDNEPPLGGLPPLSQLGLAYRLLKDFKTADKMFTTEKPDVGYRPVAHLAVSTKSENTEIIAPTWLRLRPAEELPRIDKADFRDELRVEHYPDQRLLWVIEVASGKRKNKSSAEWITLGRLVLNESITSPACDQQLHFAHPVLH